MLKTEKIEVFNFEGAIRGARNPMNSWEKSDSLYVCETTKMYDEDRLKYAIGPNDLDLLKRLRKGGSDDRKYLRQIFISVDITAPLYWWKEMDQYKVGTTTDSCSTMHKIASKEFSVNDFSNEHLIGNCDFEYDYKEAFLYTIRALNHAREEYLKTKDKKYWWQIIQLLPSSYNQKRTWTANYEVLCNIYHARKNHKLDEWHVFCDTIRTLPYAEELIVANNK